MGEKRNAYIGLLMGRPEGKKPLGSHRCRWQDNIIMYERSRIGWYGLDSSG
jgi:hypothetical protein